MQRIIWRAAPIVLLTVSAGCSQGVTAPAGDMMLSSLRFAEAEIEPGEPLIVAAQTASGDLARPQPFVVRASSGASQQGSFEPWRRSPWETLSDEGLAAVIAHWHNVALIGFKEADAERGVDEQGRSITSEETIERTKQWLREQGVTITREWILLPGVTGTMPADAGLVATIRRHANVDYLEPSPPVEPDAGTEAVTTQSLVAVILTSSDDARRLLVQRGDVVTATYRQPDGAVLHATASVR